MWVNSLWKRSQILCERVTDSLYSCFVQDGVGESNRCIRTFWRWWVLLFVYSLLWKIGFCALSIWAKLDFRIQFNELLNSVTDKKWKQKSIHRGKHVHHQWFSIYRFDVNLKYNETTRFPHVFKICGTGAKKKKNSFVSPYPTDPLKMTLTQNIFSLKPIDFFFYQNLYFAVRGVFCTIFVIFNVFPL